MLHAEKEQIQQIIINAFNEMKSQIPLEHYVRDFVLCGDNPEEYKMHIIEVRSTANSPHWLALKLSPQNPSASPVLEVAPVSPVWNLLCKISP